MRLYSKRAKRLYLNHHERSAFEKAAFKTKDDARLLALLLLYTGCRLSEAINVHIEDIQTDDGIIAIRSLKKRNSHHIRELPIPRRLVDQLSTSSRRSGKLLSVSRTTAWRAISRLMDSVGIEGEHATPKGLRHSFGVNCAFNNVPMPLCQKWMGHADMRTTAIYYQIVGKEERTMAERMW